MSSASAMTSDIERTSWLYRNQLFSYVSKLCAQATDLQHSRVARSSMDFGIGSLRDLALTVRVDRLSRLETERCSVAIEGRSASAFKFSDDLPLISQLLLDLHELRGDVG